MIVARFELFVERASCLCPPLVRGTQSRTLTEPAYDRFLRPHTRSRGWLRLGPPKSSATATLASSSSISQKRFTACWLDMALQTKENREEKPRTRGELVVGMGPRDIVTIDTKSLRSGSARSRRSRCSCIGQDDALRPWCRISLKYAISEQCMRRLGLGTVCQGFGSEL